MFMASSNLVGLSLNFSDRFPPNTKTLKHKHNLKMSDATPPCNESSFTESKDEYLSETCDSSTDYRKLSLQNESYRQELYELNLKLFHNEAMQKELQEANELLEQSLAKEKEKTKKKLQEIQEKHRSIQETYENQLSDLVTELENKEKENKELHNLLIKHKAEISPKTVYKSDHTEEILIPLKQQLQELVIELEQERRKREQAEEMIKDLHNQLSELQEILQITKDNLREKNEILENMREELAICRMEIETLQTVPTNQLCKGNSLFAEVEDRRQVALNKVIILKKKYDEVKQGYKAKVEEVKLLKMEKATILKKWDDYVNLFSDDSDLIQKYKNRIHDLEQKLIEAQKNNIETKITDTSFSYLESLLAEKKKEIQELHQRIEHDSVDTLLQAEIKHKMTKQIQYWQSKAMHMEAQLSVIKNQLELENLNSEEYKLFLEAVEKHRTIYKDFPDKEEIPEKKETKLEEVTSHIATLKNESSFLSLTPKNILQTDVDENTSQQTTNTRECIINDNNDCEVDKSSNIDKKCLDYDNTGKSKVEDTKTIQYRETQNSTFSCTNETQKIQKIVHFSEDTKNTSSETTMKKKQNEEKKKVTKQYNTIYISSESSI